MFEWFEWLGMIYIVAMTVLIVNKLLQRLSERKFKNVVKDMFDDEKVEETRNRTIVSIFSPAYTISATKRILPTYSKKNYIHHFLIGFMLGVGLSYILYRSIPVSLLGGLVFGLLTPYFKLEQYEEKYNNEIKGKIIHYFKVFTSYMRSTNYNLTKSLDLSIASVDQPIRKDLELVLFELKQGVEPEKAFGSLYKKYPYHGVELFHHLAILISKQGQDKHDSLKEAANRFSEKRYWQNKLDQNNKKFLRDRKGITIFSLGIYLMMMFFTSDYYVSFMTSIIGIITITLSLIWYGLTMYSQLGLLKVDPTEVKD